VCRNRGFGTREDGRGEKTLRLALTSVVWATLAIGCLAAAPAADRTVSIQLGGRERTAIVHVPAGPSRVSPMPLVLVLHGGGGNAENAARMSQMNGPGDRLGFLVAYPSGTGKLKASLLTWNAWNCCGYAMENRVDDVGFLRALVARLERDFGADPKRIYATGLSNGAMMAHRLGCEMSDVVAAIAPVAGGMNTDSCTPSNPVSVVMFHGTADRHALYLGGDTRGFFGNAPRRDRPIPDAFARWSRIDGCFPSGKQTTGHVTKETCSGGRGGSEVVLYTIDGQGHAWPGGTPGIRNGNVDKPTTEISATDTIVRFFLAHPKR
jgi:polyhydroxybutyrate depolymerase